MDKDHKESAGLVKLSLEVGKKKTFASAVDWPGWSRGAPGETAALQALLDYAPRYWRAIQGSGLIFQAPTDLSQFEVVERVEGNATTDFGVPGIASIHDERPLAGEQLAQWQALLEACWRAFDTAALAAQDKDLRKGPRGGGRELRSIREHVLEAEKAYLARLGGKVNIDKTAGLEPAFEQLRRSVREALVMSARGELAESGPRGGKRWKPRYFVRRAAWHILDHAWEIEDRILPEVER